MKTANKIILETYKYYAKDPHNRRSVFMNDEGNIKCLYNSPTGSHCAIGRCLKTKYKKEGLNLKANTEDIGSLENNYELNLNKMLMPSYRGHIDSLWVALQDFHDDSSYWYFGEDLNKEYHRKFEEDLKESEEFPGLTLRGAEKLNHMLNVTKNKDYE